VMDFIIIFLVLLVRILFHTLTNTNVSFILHIGMLESLVDLVVDDMVVVDPH